MALLLSTVLVVLASAVAGAVRRPATEAGLAADAIHVWVVIAVLLQVMSRVVQVTRVQVASVMMRTREPLVQTRVRVSE